MTQKVVKIKIDTFGEFEKWFCNDFLKDANKYAVEISTAFDAHTKMSWRSISIYQTSYSTFKSIFKVNYNEQSGYATFSLNNGENPDMIHFDVLEKLMITIEDYYGITREELFR